MADLADAVLAADLPDVPTVPTTSSSRTLRAGESPKYEALLNESMRLFNIKGYRDTSMEDIAATVAMPASGIYRYFSGKSDILAAAFRRAADRLSAETSTIIDDASPDPEEALTAVIDAYVSRSFDQPELDYVYYSERLNMSAGRPEDPAQPAARHRGVVGGVGDFGAAGVDTGTGAIRRARRDVAGDRPRPADGLPEFGSEPSRRSSNG